MTLVRATVALLLLLAAAVPSLAADADEFARHPPITCVAFESNEVDGANSLRLGRCLTAGDVICSSMGGWAFGIDPTDRMIKLWQGDRVSRNFFIRMYVLDRRVPAGWASRDPSASIYTYNVHGQRYG